jgi:glycosyltransferase involved in cell wall biosynthesis
MNVVLYTEGLPFTGSTLSEQALGGSETAFISVAGEMARQGHTVTAYCLCGSEGVYDGVFYKDVSKINELHRGECDLFVCSRFFKIFSEGLRAKINFLWMHDFLVPEVANNLRPFLPRIAAVYCLSEYHRRLILRVLPEAESRLHKTTNGLDFSLINEAAATVAGKKHKIMYTSRPERGLWQALDLYESLNDAGLEFLICTYTTIKVDRVEAYEARCRQRIAALVGRGFPIRTGSFVKRELYRHLSESKLVVYPTDFHEVACISALEAQACGTVILTTDDFALKETVGYKGVPPRDMPEFSRRLRAILADDGLRLALEARGREHVLPYTWKNVARTFIEEAERRSAARPAVKKIPGSHFC